MHQAVLFAATFLALPVLLLIPLILILLPRALLRAATYPLRKRPLSGLMVGFFHPFTHDGGGGERVLWRAVRAVQELAPRAELVIYSGDKDTTAEILMARAAERFGVSILRPVSVVHLKQRWWVEAAAWPRLTLMGQALGSVVLGWEALALARPAIFVDTAGYAFTYPLAKGAGAAVAAYVHYPTVSTDMLARVRERAATYNNADAIARSGVLSALKLLYYRAFAVLYGWAGQYADVVMANSSWTEGHLHQLWPRVRRRTTRVYPPCNTKVLQKLPVERLSGPQYVISVAQFRPEKAHGLQLEAFALARKQDAYALRDVRLKLVGSCRSAEDEARVAALREKTGELGLEDAVDFCINVTYKDLISLLGGAAVGLHTMTDEHFGISVVEYMAAGCVPVAHNSAGPKQDIVVQEAGQQTGFLAISVSEFATAIILALSLGEAERRTMITAARARAKRFSDECFDDAFSNAMIPLMEQLYARELHPKVE